MKTEAEIKLTRSNKIRVPHIRVNSEVHLTLRLESKLFYLLIYLTAGPLLEQSLYMVLMERLLNRSRQPLQDGGALQITCTAATLVSRH